MNGNPKADSNNRASAVVVALVLMNISIPGMNENESWFANGEFHKERWHTFYLREKRHRFRGKSKVNCPIIFTLDIVEAPEIFQSWKHNFSQE